MPKTKIKEEEKMRINNNLMAMNTHRQLGMGSAAGAKSMEKLSSGFRINRAGDDAAGLAISEKMRGQIRGLSQASRNAQDGISMIQTAEGALNETHAILQRMRELAVQSSTDTNITDDRAKIQAEVDQLAKEMTRISNTTEFNTQNLMAGGLNSTFHIGANQGQNIGLSVGAMDAQSLGVAGNSVKATSFAAGTTAITGISDVSRGLATSDTTATQFSIGVVKTAATATTVTKTSGAGTSVTAPTIANAGSYTGTTDATFMVEVSKVDAAADANNIQQIRYSKDGGTSWTAVDVTANVASIEGVDFTVATAAAAQRHAVGDTFTFDASAAKATIQLRDGATAVGSAVEVRYGATSAELGLSKDNKAATVNFNFNTLTTGTATFGADVTASSAAVTREGKVITESTVQNGIDVSTQKTASAAITTINNAITKVSEERSKLGAVQNRLEHTIKNLDTSAENLQASESRIRDVDMAKEMMEFTKNNILQQAAQAMLAQANQAPQGVLQLLR